MGYDGAVAPPHAPTPPSRARRAAALSVVVLLAISLVAACSLWEQGKGSGGSDLDGERAKELDALLHVLGVLPPADGAIRSHVSDDPVNDIASPPEDPKTRLSPTSSTETTKAPVSLPFSQRYDLDLRHHVAFRHDPGAGRDTLFGPAGTLACGAGGDLSGIRYQVHCSYGSVPDPAAVFPGATTPPTALFWFVAETTMDLTREPLLGKAPGDATWRFMAWSCPGILAPPEKDGALRVVTSGAGDNGEGIGTSIFELTIEAGTPKGGSTTTTAPPPTAPPPPQPTSTVRGQRPPPTKKPPATPPTCVTKTSRSRVVLVGRTVAIGVPIEELYAPALAWHLVTTAEPNGTALEDRTDESRTYIDDNGEERRTVPITEPTTTTTEAKTTTTTKATTTTPTVPGTGGTGTSAPTSTEPFPSFPDPSTTLPPTTLAPGTSTTIGP